MFKSILIFSLLIFTSHSYAQESEYYEEPDESLEQSEELEEDLDNLISLEDVKDIAVIQKKYLDKTKRFELWGAGALALNSQFFNFLGLNLKGTYHFSERWGVEFQGMFLSDLEKSITEGLRTDQAINTDDIITPSSYLGINLRWSPIYGKLSLKEKTINPF